MPQTEQSPAENTVAAKPTRKSTLAWVNSTYFAEGLPYMLVRIVTSVFFTDIGAKERFLGYLNFLGIPWNLKFLWSPLLDVYFTKRAWLIAMQFAIAVLTAAVAAACAFAVGTDGAAQLVFIAVVFVGMAFLAATNDVAIDGYYIEALPDKNDQAHFSGYRVMAYRVAMIFSRSGLVALAAYLASRWGEGDKFRPWIYAFGAGSLTMFLLAVWHTLRLPKVEKKRDAVSPAQALRAYSLAFATYLRQKRVAHILLFIVMYKLGDEVLFSMATPFLMRELAVTKGQFAWLGGFVGAAGSILGAMLGAFWIQKWGLKRAIWPITLLMNINIWAYVWLAAAKPDSTTAAGISIIAFVHGYEQLAAGTGNAVLVLYLLRTCHPDFKAAHYAIGSAIMSLGGTLVGGFGGEFVDRFGYVMLFQVAFLASLPSMLLLFKLPLLDEDKSAAVTPSA